MLHHARNLGECSFLWSFGDFNENTNLIRHSSEDQAHRTKHTEPREKHSAIRSRSAHKQRTCLISNLTPAAMRRQRKSRKEASWVGKKADSQTAVASEADFRIATAASADVGADPEEPLGPAPLLLPGRWDCEHSKPKAREGRWEWKEMGGGVGGE